MLKNQKGPFTRSKKHCEYNYQSGIYLWTLRFSPNFSE